MPICKYCKERNTCTEACRELKRELSQVTTQRNKREKSFDPRLLNNKLTDSGRGHYEWTDKKELQQKRPTFAGKYVRKTFIEKDYNKIHRKLSRCYIYENKNGKKGKLKRKI